MQRNMARKYIMLRPAQGVGGGFARLEICGGRVSFAVQVTRLPMAAGSLRVMLYAPAGINAETDEGALLDLGVMPVEAGCGTWRREDLAVAGADGVEAYRELLLASDWPRPQLVLSGSLREGRACPRWQMEQALMRHLQLPAQDTPLPERPAEEVCLQPLRSLPDLLWPEKLRPLQAYFDELPPCAPFDAPGWRFVRVALEDGPAPYCCVGVRRQGHRITAAMYALPGEENTALHAVAPNGLEGYSRRIGRGGQRYWVMEQEG